MIDRRKYNRREIQAPVWWDGDGGYHFPHVMAKPSLSRRKKDRRG